MAAGRGKRLKENSENQPKCLIEINKKPLLEYSLDNSINAGIDEIVIVVGYKAEDIINIYGNRYMNKSVKYVIQQEQRGLVHAIECSRNAMEGSDFMLMLSDELMLNPRHKAFLNKYKTENLFGLCGVVLVEDINLVKKTYSIVQDKENKILRLIEKPTQPMNNIMGTGNCVFKNKIYDYIDDTPINQIRGEKELPDLIQYAVDRGHMIKSFFICDRYLNINYPEEIEMANSSFAHF